MLLGELQRRVAVSGFGDHLESLNLLEHDTDALAHHGVIVGDHHSQSVVGHCPSASPVVDTRHLNANARTTVRPVPYLEIALHGRDTFPHAGETSTAA